MELLSGIRELVEILHIADVVRGQNRTFVFKETFNSRPFHALIDTGSTILLFTHANVNKVSVEKNVDFSKKKQFNVPWGSHRTSRMWL